MERITSRKNEKIRHLKKLWTDRVYRYASGEYVCDGWKLLEEATANGAEITYVLFSDENEASRIPDGVPAALAPYDLIEAVSGMKSPQTVLFSCAIPAPGPIHGERVLILETVQDPGNLGTILRTANAFSISDVILTGACADLYNPKTVRASMGAIFRQNTVSCTLEALAALRESGLRILGAALREDAQSILTADLSASAVAIGSEGSGLSEELCALCDGFVRIPMSPDCESLNAGVAASIVMWEMRRGVRN